MRVVTAKGHLIEVSADSAGIEKYLWCSMRGAGHSFGLVTSIKAKVHPEMNGGNHWTKLLIFAVTPEKMEEVAQIAVNMNFGDRSSSIMFFRPLPSTGEPSLSRFGMLERQRRRRSIFLRILRLVP